MTQLTVSHYLKVYKHRLDTVERGVITPPTEIVAGIRKLVAALERQDSAALVNISVSNKTISLTSVENGNIIASTDAHPDNIAT